MVERENMYNFKDTKANTAKDSVFIPTSALMYNGAYLENVVEGYQTLKVEGREMSSLSFDSQEMQVGGFITSSRIPSKTLKITYKLEDKDPVKLQEKFDNLMIALYKEKDVAIKFKDMPDYTYYGRFSSADDVDGDRNAIISTFEILLSDPFKYQAQTTDTGKVSAVLPYKIAPDVVSFTMTAESATLKLNGYTVKISGVSINQVIELDFINGNVKVNNVVNNKVLSMDSDFKNIKITTKSELTGTGFKDGTIKYRKAVL
ncbi:distal tail protein Dit [Lactococcus formosensis]|uniref:distal tail protein Dit n=1 Tax=Lactococcus formosensis TaxID=1281486 RepID=UPI00326555E2